jgi:two-component system nitrogen regulation response regulator NtrX
MLPPDIGSIAVSPVRGDGEVMSLPLREAREIFERRYLDAQVTRFGGNISRTAAFVGMERSALHRKLRSLGISTNERQQPKVET